MVEVLGIINNEKISIKDFPISSENLTQLINFINNGTISGKIAKEVFSEMLTDNKTAEQIISEKNISQISDVSELKEIISNIFNDYPKQVKEYIDGKEKLIGFFVGKIMQQTQGKANPKLLNEILKNKLSSLKNN